LFEGCAATSEAAAAEKGSCQGSEQCCEATSAAKKGGSYAAIIRNPPCRFEPEKQPKAAR